MIILEDLNTTSSPSRPCALTIGCFDGVHLGHQKILSEARRLATPNGTLCVVTFSNHPTHVLPGKQPVPLIYTKEQKILALEQLGVDITYCIAFTLEIASLSYDAFLRKLKEVCPFDYLVLGHGAVLGKNREGTQENIISLSKQLAFSCVYLPKVTSDHTLISSQTIRNLIQSGDFSRVAQLLGRSLVLDAMQEDKHVIFPKHICLPPDGSYSVVINDTFPSTLVISRKQSHLLSSPHVGKICIQFD